MRFLVHFTASIGYSVEVDAESPEDAEVAAWEAFDAPYSLCHQCSTSIGDLSDWELSEIEVIP